MRHDPINASAGGSAAPKGTARRPRRAATRRPTPLDLGIPVAATEDGGEALAAEVLDPARTEPIVCLSTRAGEDRPAFDHHQVRKAVGRDALLRAVRTGPASRYLSALLPPQLGVFGGGARIWWPGVDAESDPSDHPLVLDRMGRYGPKALEALAERFAEGPPAPSRRGAPPRRHDGDRAPGDRRAGGTLVAFPGGAADERDRRSRESRTPPATPDRDQQLLLGALDGAREEIRALREKLAEVRLDAMTSGGRPATRTDDEPSSGRAPVVPPRAARPEQVAELAIPAAVVRDRVRAHHLEIVAAWLARDHDAGRRERPLGPLAIGEGYLASIDAQRHRVSPAVLATTVARIASGKQGEADDLDVGASVDDHGDQEFRATDGAAGWSCRVPDAGGDLRLRWWTRDDGAVELRDVV
jgi:hypothetical protein